MVRLHRKDKWMDKNSHNHLNTGYVETVKDLIDATNEFQKMGMSEQVKYLDSYRSILSNAPISLLEGLFQEIHKKGYKVNIQYLVSNTLQEKRKATTTA
jgi:hypothetical protein